MPRDNIADLVPTSSNEGPVPTIEIDTLAEQAIAEGVLTVSFNFARAVAILTTERDLVAILEDGTTYVLTDFMTAVENGILSRVTFPGGALLPVQEILDHAQSTDQLAEVLERLETDAGGIAPDGASRTLNDDFDVLPSQFGFAPTGLAAQPALDAVSLTSSRFALPATDSAFPELGTDTELSLPAGIGREPGTLSSDDGPDESQLSVIEASPDGDTIHAGNGNDLMKGNLGDDTLLGEAGDDIVQGGGGNDLLYGGAGVDTVSGGDGEDTILGGTGSDAITGNDGNDELHGNEGDDVIVAGDGEDIAYGGDGDDTMDGSSGSDTLLGGDGDDSVDGGTGSDLLYGGNGNDTMAGGDGNDTLLAGNGQDVLKGGDGNDLLQGQAGNDFIDGGDGTDLVYGGSGNDVIAGGGGKDTLLGEDGNDTLSGDAGNDVLQGGSGDDVLAGGTGNDVLYGGSGSDTASYATATGSVIVNLATGVVTGADGNDALVDVENVAGSAHGDRIAGNSGANIVDGGAGADTLSGGGGADVFRFSLLDESVDTLSDFSEQDGDRLDLSDVLSVGTDQALGDYVRLREDADGNAVLQVDTDGTDSGEDFQDVAILEGVTDLDLESVIVTNAPPPEEG